MIVWNPDKCSINDEVRVDDYLGIHPAGDTAPVTQKERAVVLEPDVRAYFPNSEAVNTALRSLIHLMSEMPRTDKPYVRRAATARQVAERK